MLVGVSDNDKCVNDAMVSVCMCRCVCVCVSLQLISFKLSSGYLFSPHHVNQGGVQKATPQVTLYEPHTAEESLRRHRVAVSARYCLAMRAQVRELLHVLLPPHERVCVKGHLLHSRVGIQLGLHTVDIDIHGCTTT